MGMMQLDEADFGFVPDQKTIKATNLSGIPVKSEKPAELECVLYMVCPKCADLMPFNEKVCSSCGTPLHGKNL